MKIYIVSYLDSESERREYFSNKKEAEKCLSGLKKELEEGDIENLFGIDCHNIELNKKGILRFLNQWCSEGE